MTKSQKIEILYKKAKGIRTKLTNEEAIELSRYRVELREGDFYTTKANIRDYVNAVDNEGCLLPFYDWCMNNNRADRRRRGGSEEALAKSNKERDKGIMFGGFFFWGIAIYWTFQETISILICGIIGAVITLFLYKLNRKNSTFKLVWLPLLIAIFFASR